jgi:hypothetical protein
MGGTNGDQWVFAEQANDRTVAEVFDAQGALIDKSFRWIRHGLGLERRISCATRQAKAA